MIKLNQSRSNCQLMAEHAPSTIICNIVGISVGYLTDGVQWITNPSALRALWQFPRDLRSSQGNMVRACEQFFNRLNYTVIIQRQWRAPAGRILFISDHRSALDGFAMSLACPRHLPLKRIMFRLTAQLFGNEMIKNCLTVWPRGNYYNLCFQTFGLLDRIVYLMTHRWGPWVKKQLALQRIVDALAQGECLTLLPSGTVGESRWRSGIGGIILEMARQRPELLATCFLAPIYLDWDRAHRRVKINAPQLISFADILSELPPDTNRLALTAHLLSRYHQDSGTR